MTFPEYDPVTEWCINYKYIVNRNSKMAARNVYDCFKSLHVQRGQR